MQVDGACSLSCRMTAPVGGEDNKSIGNRAQETLDRAGEHARSTADEAADSTKSTYNKIKSSISGFLGGAKHPDDKCGCAHPVTVESSTVFACLRAAHEELQAVR